MSQQTSDQIGPQVLVSHLDGSATGLKDLLAAHTGRTQMG